MARIALAGCAVVAALALAGCQQPADSSDASAVADVSGFPITTPSQEADYLRAVRSLAPMRDDDETLIAVGQDVCYEIAQHGKPWMLENLGQSSFLPAQQAAIVTAAEQYLC